MLLVLDNFEQVVEGAAVVGELVAACEDVKVVVTSRTPLRLSSETLFPLPPLELPDEAAGPGAEEAMSYPSVALFVTRAQAVDPEFELSGENVAAVVEICRRLDGLPLALELAAARVNLFTPQAMLLRLERRLDLLTGGMRDAPERHRTLRDALDWSYELLDDREQAFFRRLGVFVSGCDIDSVEAIVSGSRGQHGGSTQGNDLLAKGENGSSGSLAALDGLAALHEKSLLAADERGSAEPRFTMLESVRQYALERLSQAGELEQARGRHARYFLELAERAEGKLTGADQQAWLDRLELEHGNLRAGLALARRAGEAELALRMAASLWRFWIVRGHLVEGRQLLEGLRQSFPVRRDESREVLTARARALHGLGTLVHEIGAWQEARPLLEESLATWRQVEDEGGTATALNSLGWVSCILGDFAAARALSREARALHEKLEDARGVALALNNMGWAATFQGDFAGAGELQGESLSLRVAARDRRGIAYAKTNLGWVLRNQGCFAEAAVHLGEALAMLRELHDDQLSAWSLLHWGQTHYDQGKLGEARTAFEESEALWRAVGNRTGLCWTLIALGYVLRGTGEGEAARRTTREGLEMARTIGHEWGSGYGWCGLAWLELEQGSLESAESALRESLSFRGEIEDRAGTAECLDCLSELRLAQGRWEEAASWLGTAEALRETIPRPPVDLPRFEASSKRLRGALGERFERCLADGFGQPSEGRVAKWLEDNSRA